MNILKDIRNFSGSYKQRESNNELLRVKRDEIYNSIIVNLIGATHMEEEKVEDILSILPKDEFESLKHKIKSYYKKSR
jgi:hypothetical protein